MAKAQRSKSGPGYIAAADRVLCKVAHIVQEERSNGDKVVLEINWMQYLDRTPRVVLSQYKDQTNGGVYHYKKPVLNASTIPGLIKALSAAVSDKSIAAVKKLAFPSGTIGPVKQPVNPVIRPEIKAGMSLDGSIMGPDEMRALVMAQSKETAPEPDSDGILQ